MPWWWPFGGKEEPPEKASERPPSVSEHTLADIARGMQHAVNSTQRLTEHHYVHLFERYFGPDGRAITQRVVLPDGAHVLDIPVISLIPPNGLVLKEMTVDLAVRIDHAVCKRAAPKGMPSDITRTSFEVSFSPRAQDRGAHKHSARQGSAVDIRMKFVAGDPPEGVARVMEYYTNALVPKALDSGGPQSSAGLAPDAPPAGTRGGAEWEEVPGSRTEGDPDAVLEVPERDEDARSGPEGASGGPEPHEPPGEADGGAQGGGGASAEGATPDGGA